MNMGPRIVRSGLVLNLDAAQKTSYSGTGTTWYDLSGNKNNGILTNGPTFSSANAGSIVFDGMNDQVVLTSANLPISGNGARSIFAWIKSTSTSTCYVSTGTATNSQSFNLVKYSNNIGIMGYNLDYYPTTGSSDKNVADGNWHYVGVSFNGTNLSMYVDAILDNTSGTFTYSTTGQNNYIARSNHVGNENYVNGSIAIVKIYNRALSASEILQNYNATKGRFGL